MIVHSQPYLLSSEEVFSQIIPTILDSLVMVHFFVGVIEFLVQHRQLFTSNVRDLHDVFVYGDFHMYE